MFYKNFWRKGMNGNVRRDKCDDNKEMNENEKGRMGEEMKMMMKRYEFEDEEKIKER